MHAAHAQVASSLASAMQPSSGSVSSTQAYNTAYTFTAAAAKAQRVQPSLSAQVCLLAALAWQRIVC